MSTFRLTRNLKSPDRNKQFISNIPRNCLTEVAIVTGVLSSINGDKGSKIKQEHTQKDREVYRRVLSSHPSRHTS